MPVQEFARLDGAVNLSVITNATPEEFTLSGVYCIDQITEKVILSASWKNRFQYRSQKNDMSGPKTRARSKGNIPQPKQTGLHGKMISTALVSGWNRLPLAIKDEEDAQKAKQLIKKFAFS